MQKILFIVLWLNSSSSCITKGILVKNCYYPALFWKSGFRVSLVAHTPSPKTNQFSSFLVSAFIRMKNKKVLIVWSNIRRWFRVIGRADRPPLVFESSRNETSICYGPGRIFLKTITAAVFRTLKGRHSTVSL